MFQRSWQWRLFPSSTWLSRFWKSCSASQEASRASSWVAASPLAQSSAHHAKALSWRWTRFFWIDTLNPHKAPQAHLEVATSSKRIFFSGLSFFKVSTSTHLAVGYEESLKKTAVFVSKPIVFFLFKQLLTHSPGCLALGGDRTTPRPCLWACCELSRGGASEELFPSSTVVGPSSQWDDPLGATTYLFFRKKTTPRLGKTVRWQNIFLEGLLQPPTN